MAQVPSMAKWLIVGLVASALGTWWGFKQLGQLTEVPVVSGLVIFTIMIDMILKKLSPPRKRYPCSWCGLNRGQ